MQRITILTSLFAVLLPAVPSFATDAAPPQFTRDIAPILTKYCAGCHNSTDREGGLILESFADMQKGGENGAIIVPGQAGASKVIRSLAGEIEPKMPPDDNPRPTEQEIALLRAWIDAGAPGPTGDAMPPPELKTPLITVADGVRPYLTSLALAPDGRRLALGSYRRVELVDPITKKVLATSGAHSGKINAISFSRDGSLFVASSGIAGLYGIATVGRTQDASIVTTIRAHRDAIYDGELNPDGKLLATCSYDRAIHLWDVSSGQLVRSFAGHNGAVYDLAFSPDGAVLASASADATIKLWSVSTGERLDTLGQPEGEQCAVAFSPDSQSLVAGGGDRQLRLWSFVSRESPQINPLRLSGTAHESSIQKLVFSHDGSRVATASEGREMVLWDVATLTPIHRFERQPDVVTGLAFTADDKQIYVASIDGSWRGIAVPALNPGHVAKTDQTSIAVPPASSTADTAATATATEQEPNNAPAEANPINANAFVRGIIAAPAAGAAADVDIYRFHAQAGQQLVLEINAARDKSSLDSKIEVLDAAGNPIPRVVLQAVRSSYFTFRGHNSTDTNDFRMHGAADMELNEYVYANGEIMKLWMLPRGPDSGFIVYPGAAENRYAFFGSTSITHALNQPAYVVRPYPPGATIIPNGLPVFTHYFENDDDGFRALGADSRLTFTAPTDGDYLVRVSDVRGFGGASFTYQLTIRPRRPDFEIKIDAPDLSINAGSGKEFGVIATRKDEFDGEIRIEFSGLPAGFHVTTPLTIQAGQFRAYGTLTAEADAPAPAAEHAKLTKATASANVDGEQVTKTAVDVGEIKLSERPKLLIHVLPKADDAEPATIAAAKSHQQPAELVIAPGETIAATLQVERRGFDGEIKFGGELSGRNLPHGVYVDNIGLNGVTLLAGDSQRTIFITARKWVAEQSRPFHLQAEIEGKQTSWPVILHVRQRANALPGSASQVTQAEGQTSSR